MIAVNAKQWQRCLKETGFWLEDVVEVGWIERTRGGREATKGGEAGEQLRAVAS